MEQWASQTAMKELEHAYGLRIRALLPLRSVVGLLTDKGKFMCKRYTDKQGMERDRLLAVTIVRDQLCAAGIGPAYLRTRTGEAVWSYGECPITVEPWLPGRHADFTMRNERILSVQAAARLHTAHVDAPYLLRHPPTLVQKLAYRLERADELARQGALIGLTADEWQLWRKRAEESLRSLPTVLLTRMIEEDRARGVYCHRDLAPHNILMQPGCPGRLIDFDLSGVDSPVYDLHQLLGHVAYAAPALQNYECDMLQAYARMAPLSSRHVAMLQELAPFPSLLLRELSETRGLRSARSRRRAIARVRFARDVEERRWVSLARARRFVVC